MDSFHLFLPYASHNIGLADTRQDVGEQSTTSYDVNPSWAFQRDDGQKTVKDIAEASSSKLSWSPR